MLAIMENLSVDEWGGFIVPHKYMGPLPAFFYPVAQLVDYTVHTWDIRQGRAHALDGDAAELLVPFCFIVWQSTADCAGVEPFTIGVRLSGHNGGDDTSFGHTRRRRTRAGRRERSSARARVRPGELRAHSHGSRERRHGARRLRSRRALLQPVLPNLTCRSAGGVHDREPCLEVVEPTEVEHALAHGAGDCSVNVREWSWR